MKPFRLLREKMEVRRETRAKGHDAVNINLDLAYRLKAGEEQVFLEPSEIEMINNRIRASLALMPTGISKEEAITMANRIKDEAVTELGPFSKRVSAYLLRTAVQLRYRNREGRVEVPRMGADGTKPGVWWGELRIQLEDYPSHLEVLPQVATWLMVTWFDDKVQNGLDDKVQSWANVFETEMERLKKEVGA